VHKFQKWSVGDVILILSFVALRSTEIHNILNHSTNRFQLFYLKGIATEKCSFSHLKMTWVKAITIADPMFPNYSSDADSMGVIVMHIMVD